MNACDCVGLEEIRLAGAAEVQVMRRLRGLLDDLETEAPDNRQRALHEEGREVDLVLAGDRANGGDVRTGASR